MIRKFHLSACHFPTLAFHDERLQHIVLRTPCRQRLRPITPQPFHRLRKLADAATNRVSAIVPRMRHVVARETQRRLHKLIVVKPMSEQRIPRIIPAVVQKYAQRFGLGFPHKRRIAVTAPHRHKRAYTAVHPTEHVGTTPSQSKRSYSAAACASHGVHIGISGDAYSKRRQHAPHLRKQHVDNEVGHTVRQSVKLIAAIVAHRRAVAVLHHARVDKHSHDWRH